MSSGMVILVGMSSMISTKTRKNKKHQGQVKKSPTHTQSFAFALCGQQDLTHPLPIGPNAEGTATAV